MRSGNQTSLLADGTGNAELDKALEIAGYSYDPIQDIFYSTMDPWQRHIGYCRLYDEAAPLMGMVIDCEPIYFDYNGKKWVVELWKGQYDLVTGCEIGVYNSSLNPNIPGVFSGTFYTCASNAERLQMSCTLKKHGIVLFTREGQHWWLTGFKLGEFSEPSDLSMDAAITLHNMAMRDAFVTGLKNAGYSDDEFEIKNNTISFTFNIPRTRQPMTRKPEIDLIIQVKNKKLCDLFQAITGPHTTVLDKLKAIEQQAPELYRQIMFLGKTKKLYEALALVIMIGTLLLSWFPKNKD